MCQLGIESFVGMMEGSLYQCLSFVGGIGCENILEGGIYRAQISGTA